MKVPSIRHQSSTSPVDREAHLHDFPRKLCVLGTGTHENFDGSCLGNRNACRLIGIALINYFSKVFFTYQHLLTLLPCLVLQRYIVGEIGFLVSP